jgi:hypothetical protein
MTEPCIGIERPQGLRHQTIFMSPGRASGAHPGPLPDNKWTDMGPNLARPLSSYRIH